MEIYKNSILEDFGRLVAKEFDRTINKTRRNFQEKDHPSDAAFHALLASLSEPERSIKIVQIALEGFIHDFMSVMDDSHVYKIFAREEPGDLVNLEDLSDEGLHFEQVDWITNYSKNGSALGEILEIYDKLKDAYPSSKKITKVEETSKNSILDDFGRLVVKMFDGTIDKTRRRLQSKDHPSDAAFLALITSLPEPERSIKIVQRGLEGFVHDFMSAMDDSDVYKIFAGEAGGGLVNLEELSDEGLHFEQVDWIEKYSKNGSVLGVVLEMAEKLKEDDANRKK